MEALKMIPFIFLMLAIGGIVAGTGLIVQSKFKETISQPCFNSSYTLNTSRSTSSCHDSSGAMTASVGEESRNLSPEYFGIDKAQEGMTEIATQFPTIGIIAAMVIIISLIAGVFVYMRMFA